MALQLIVFLLQAAGIFRNFLKIEFAGTQCVGDSFASPLYRSNPPPCARAGTTIAYDTALLSDVVAYYYDERSCLLRCVAALLRAAMVADTGYASFIRFAWCYYRVLC